jgi:hypothetical protein
VKHAAAPYTSPRCLLSEPVTGASPKPSVDIVHPPPRSSRRRATPIDLQCRLHFDEHRACALLLLNLQVNASELSPDQMSVSPYASTVLPPSKKRRRAAPSATSSAPDPLGEPHRHPSCPTTSPHRPRIHAADHAAREPAAIPGRPRHRAVSGHGDHAARMPAAPAGTGQTGHRRVAMGRVNRPPPSLGPSHEHAAAPNQVQSWAKSRPGTVHQIFGFSISFTFSEIRLNF